MKHNVKYSWYMSFLWYTFKDIIKLEPMGGHRWTMYLPGPFLFGISFLFLFIGIIFLWHDSMQHIRTYHIVMRVCKESTFFIHSKITYKNIQDVHISHLFNNQMFNHVVLSPLESSSLVTPNNYIMTWLKFSTTTIPS